MVEKVSKVQLQLNNKKYNKNQNFKNNYNKKNNFQEILDIEIKKIKRE